MEYSQNKTIWISFNKEDVPPIYFHLMADINFSTLDLGKSVFQTIPDQPISNNPK